MTPLRSTLPCLAAVLLAVSFAPGRAQAAEAYDNCKGFIAALPATISTAGTWCLNKDLSTALASGAAITITAPFVTLDCNAYKLTGTAAGMGTQTFGIASTQRNTTVRDCDVRGFLYGTAITAINAVVEDSRLDANRMAGIYGDGDGFSIRRNTITRSGGSPTDLYGFGIRQYGSGDVIDNTITGVTNSENEGYSYGIDLGDNHGGSVRGNRIRDLTAPDIGQGAAIYVEGDSDGVTIEDNVIHVGPDDYFSGIVCVTEYGAMARRNAIQGKPYNSQGVYGCVDAGDNYVGTTIVP